MNRDGWRNRIVGEGEEAPGLCPLCYRLPDWRGWQHHHVVPKGLGGDPKGKRTETTRICARCHAKRHHLQEVESNLMWGSGSKHA